MNWKRVILLCAFALVLILAIVKEAESASVRGNPAASKEKQEEIKKGIFMPEAEASKFFKRRAKRSPKSRDEMNAENRQRLAADERRREYYEEQRNEYENYVEEERDEQYERTREKTEQWREWHYDGLYPPYEYNRHHV
ncbi:upper zone of growth plate and cartilage matrix associated a [Erpetoichthys calabaricus]|uniref:Unique cartilage matrix-associated protein n=1 Tax=Erpetoichthys calabaricus TaxID=27687 RepID=A0A8C4S0S2_ERPCA|nr:upper zone of growth plate and cartilage matrix associated a [Erpetoichthys calabaricus]